MINCNWIHDNYICFKQSHEPIAPIISTLCVGGLWQTNRLQVCSLFYFLSSSVPLTEFWAHIHRFFVCGVYDLTKNQISKNHIVKIESISIRVIGSKPEVGLLWCQVVFGKFNMTKNIAVPPINGCSVHKLWKQSRFGYLRHIGRGRKIHLVESNLYLGHRNLKLDRSGFYLQF